MSPITAVGNQVRGLAHRADRLRAERAAALAVSGVQAVHVHRDRVQQVVADTLRRYGGRQGVAAALAERYGQDQEQAARRMAWALDTIDQAWGEPR